MKRAANSALRARRSRSSLFMKERMASGVAAIFSNAHAIEYRAARAREAQAGRTEPVRRRVRMVRRTPAARASVCRAARACRAVAGCRAGAGQSSCVGWHATRFIDSREVRSNLHHLQDR
ncbi:hypothetical protein BVI434_3260006 [Burkholderia vietnamiensis]|nr:hypothetical protein BVI434_3260006 [Burkholderia vietnamiensis]